MECTWVRPGTQAMAERLLEPRESSQPRKPAEKAQVAKVEMDGSVRPCLLGDHLETWLAARSHLSSVFGYSRCLAAGESGAPRCCPLVKWTAPWRGPSRAGACAVAAISRPWAMKTVMSLEVVVPSLPPRLQHGVRAT